MRIDLQNSNKDQIVTFAKDFVENEVLTAFPELKDKISVVLTGSIALDTYDAHSDIDLNFIFPQELFDIYKSQLKEYKRGIVEKYPQIQPFFKDTYEDLQSLLDWNSDFHLKEFSTAIIIYDLNNIFLDFQRKIQWYPEDVYKEEVKWLYAELVFELTDRWKVALERNDIFFTEVTKIRIIQLIVNILFLLNKHYPVGNKQLYKISQRLPDEPEGIKKLVKDIIVNHNNTELTLLFQKAKEQLEETLIEKNLIPKQETKYWITLRPKYMVEI